MTETYCVSADVKLKSGSSTPTLTASQYTKLINQAESLINLRIRNNLLGIYSTLDDGVKLILEDACSSRAAYTGVIHFPDSYTSGQTTNLLNVNATLFNEAMAELKNQDVVALIKGE